jgi:hypothetical protein
MSNIRPMADSLLVSERANEKPLLEVKEKDGVSHFLKTLPEWG